jgi:hypothetical protein
MNHALLPGPGDLLPIYAGHPHDPRTPDADDSDDVEECQDLIAKIRQEIDMAETALFLRDMEKARKALQEALFALEEALS